MQSGYILSCLTMFKTVHFVNYIPLIAYKLIITPIFWLYCIQETNIMTSTLTEKLSKFNATQKDVKGNGFGVLERNVEKLSRGNHEVKVKLIYDFTVDGAIAIDDGTVALREVGSSTAFILPNNCQITRSDKQIVTTFTSATDAALLSLGIASDDAKGIEAETAISTGTGWDLTAKIVAGIQTGTTATASEVTTAERNVIIQNGHASEVNTAGKLYLYITYVELN